MWGKERTEMKRRKWKFQKHFFIDFLDEFIFSFHFFFSPYYSYKYTFMYQILSLTHLHTLTSYLLFILKLITNHDLKEQNKVYHWISSSISYWTYWALLCSSNRTWSSCSSFIFLLLFILFIFLMTRRFVACGCFTSNLYKLVVVNSHFIPQ